MIWNDNIIEVKTKWGTLVHKDGDVNVITTYTFPPNCLKEAWSFKEINKLDASININKNIFEDGKVKSITVRSNEFRKIEEHPLWNNDDGGEEE